MFTYIHIHTHTWWHGGSVACTACTAASQQEGHGFDSRMGRCWLWGAGPPQTSSAQVGYLPGLSVWSLHVLPVFTRGFSPLRTPTEKHAKEQNTLRRSLTKTDGSPHLVPGRLKAAHCSWGPGGRTVRDGINAEAKFTNDLRPACVCVCPVSPPCIHVCSVSLVRLKSDNYL